MLGATHHPEAVEQDVRLDGSRLTGLRADGRNSRDIVANNHFEQRSATSHQVTATTSWLDWNENPLGPSPEAVARVIANAVDLHRYPRGLLESVTAAAARHHGVDAGSVLITNGVDEATDLVLTLVDTAWFVSPGFDGYEHRARVLGRALRPIPLDETWEPTTEPTELAEGGAVFLAQPHNPTGNLFRSEWVRDVIGTAELAFLDEAYLDFADAPSYLGLLAEHPGLLVFKSPSKAYGLAGVRLGVLIGSPALISALRERRRFYSVDSIALHALAGALTNLDHVARLRRYVQRMRCQYAAMLAGSPLFAEVRTTHANFVIARCREDLSPAVVVEELAAREVWVRDCQSFGLDGWLRISIGTVDDLRLLTDALAAIDRARCKSSSAPLLFDDQCPRAASATGLDRS
jgi:histidinol-phosphate aminotransferase